MGSARRRRVVVLGPHVEAVSGVSTHLRQLFDSQVGEQLELIHFQTGSEGRAAETAATKLWRLATAPLALSWALLRTGARVVHVNSAMEHKAFWRDMTFVLAARALGRRVVFQVHGGHLPEDFARAVPGGTRVLRRLLGLPTVIVLLAEAERVAYGAFDARLEVTVVRNAIDADFLPQGPGVGFARTPLLELVYVGRLARVKGIFEAAQATAAAAARGLPVRMTYAGAGPDEAELREVVARSGHGDAFRFVGPVFGPEKTRLWRESDVLVFPTYHREGLPYSLLEAMATETLVVTTPVGGIPDVVGPTQAVLVEPRDPDALLEALVWVDAHRDRAATLVEAASRRVVEAFLVERLARDFLELYETAADARAR